VRELLRRASAFVRHLVTAKNGDTKIQGVSLIGPMTCVVPVIATDNNGFSEAVIDGEIGILVPEYDIGAIRDAMIRLQADSSLAAKMGRSGRERVVSHFESINVATRLREILSSATIRL
jgi:colanic acid/amylovoran biosynthesis glycosyltransferase